MAKREFLQLAHPYKPAKHVIAGWFASEKLDGQRCLWDGGITRGLPAKNVPWANTAKDKKTRISSGLWSRYGKPVHAPDWWLDKLPSFPIDGELWAGRGNFQLTRSVVSKHAPVNSEWERISFMVFDSPTMYDIFYDGVIDDTRYKKKFINIPEWLYARGANLMHHSANSFDGVLGFLKERLQENDVVKLHEQVELSMLPSVTAKEIHDLLEEILSGGGEGLVVRDPHEYWIPERTHNMVKIKPTNDAEATVVGYVTGRETDKGSKLLGLMGAMIVEFEGKRFEISGFTDSERELTYSPGNSYAEPQDATRFAIKNPGCILPEHYCAKHFPRGSIITFKYRELSDDGIPKEARYYRKP